MPNSRRPKQTYNIEFSILTQYTNNYNNNICDTLCLALITDPEHMHVLIQEFMCSESMMIQSLAALALAPLLESYKFHLRLCLSIATIIIPSSK